MATTRISVLHALLAEAERAGYQFVTVTPATHARVNARSGNQEARDLLDIFGWSQPFREATIGTSLFALLAEADAVEPVGELWKSRLRIASLDGRLYLHSAYPTIENDAVFFGPDTYRFARASLDYLPQRRYGRAVDLGCGSGAGGLTVAHRRTVEDLYLTDINPRALELAAANAAAQGLTPQTVESDLFASLEGRFDLVLANPPYMADPAKRAYRDGGRLRGLELSLRIIREGVERLTDRGVLFLYTGVAIRQGQDPLREFVIETLPSAGVTFDYRELDPDVFGEELDRPAYQEIDRIAAVALLAVKTGEAHK